MSIVSYSRTFKYNRFIINEYVSFPDLFKDEFIIMFNFMFLYSVLCIFGFDTLCKGWTYTHYKI